MREKQYFHYISHVMVSFCLFILAGKLSYTIMDAFSSLGVAAAELLAFLFASSVAVLAFHLYEAWFPAPEGENASPCGFPKRKKKGGVIRRGAELILHTLLSSALLIVIMYLVNVTFGLEGELVNAVVYEPDMLSFLALMVVHPGLEEYMFRSLYYGRLRAMSPIFACLMQAVMFAISHSGVGGMMYALVAGIILGAAAETSCGIAVPVAAHIIINLRTFLMSGILPEAFRTPIDLAVIAAGAVSFLVLVLTGRLTLSDARRVQTGTEREEADFDE